MIPLVAGQVYKQDEALDYKQQCYYNGSFCSNNAVCFAVFVDPDDVLITSGNMTNNYNYHNFTLTADQVNKDGDYRVSIVCEDQNQSNFGSFTFEVTPTGDEKPSGVIVLLFYIGFLVVVGGFILTFSRVLLQLPSLTVDLLDVLYSVAVFFVFFGFATLQIRALNDALLTNINTVILNVAMWTHLLLPLIAFFLTITLGNLKKLTENGDQT